MRLGLAVNNSLTAVSLLSTDILRHPQVCWRHLASVITTCTKLCRAAIVVCVWSLYALMHAQRDEVQSMARSKVILLCLTQPSLSLPHPHAPCAVYEGL